MNRTSNRSSNLNPISLRKVPNKVTESASVMAGMSTPVSRSRRGPSVLIVAPSLIEPATSRGAGIEEIDHRLASSLLGRFDVTLVGPFFERFLGEFRTDLGVRVLQVPFPAINTYPPRSRGYATFAEIFVIPAYSIVLALGLARLSLKSRELVIVHNGLPGFVAAAVCVVRGSRIVFSEGNVYPWYVPPLMLSRSSLLRRLSRFLLTGMGKAIINLSRGVRAQSNTIKTAMTKHGVPAGLISVIPAGIDQTRLFAIDKSRPEAPLRVAFVGRLTEEKGAPLLAQVARQSSEALPAIQFDVVGDGPYRPALARMKNVTCHGWLSKEGLAGAISGAHAVLSFQREFGLAEEETMAAGRILIALRAPDVERYVRNRETGLLCDANPESYVLAIRELSTNPSLAEEMSLKAQAIARQEFDWRSIGEHWVRLMAQIAAPEA